MDIGTGRFPAAPTEKDEQTTMMMGLLGWTGAVFGFGFLVLIHELGHFLALKRCGLPVHAFSIGFGSPIWHRRFGGTDYRLGWIPLGGYVMTEDPLEMDRREAAGEPLLSPTPAGQQLVVALAGPAANLVLAVVLFTWLNAGWGEPVPMPVIEALVKGGAAATAGLQAGDRILALDGKPVTDWPGLLARLQDPVGRLKAL